MEEMENKERKDEIFSKAVRAGKRTYFFDVKATRSNEYYITITESKRKFNNDQGTFFYEKHKLFLYFIYIVGYWSDINYSFIIQKYFNRA